MYGRVGKVMKPHRKQDPLKYLSKIKRDIDKLVHLELDAKSDRRKDENLDGEFLLPMSTGISCCDADSFFVYPYANKVECRKCGYIMGLEVLLDIVGRRIGKEEK